MLTVLAACGVEPGGEPTATTVAAPTTSTTSEPATTTTPPSDVISTGDLDVIVPPDQSGAYPDDVMVSCGNGTFPVGALKEIRPLDGSAPDGVTEAMESFLSNEEGQYWPQEGWRILHETDQRMLLVARDGETLSFMTISNDGSGWTWTGASASGDPCRLEFTVPEELNRVDWRLDPEASELTAGATSIEVVLNERECTGGQEIGDRLVGPQIVMTDTQVFIAFAAERPEGDAFTCQSNPDMQYVVELPEALGDRELVEGLQTGLTLEDYLD